MGTAMADAIDYLYEQISALPECARPVLVSDGFPIANADLRVDIGVSNEDNTSEVNTEWAGLGAQREDETFEIPCLIEAYTGGAVAATPRRSAVVVLDAINSLVRSDRSLG